MTMADLGIHIISESFVAPARMFCWMRPELLDPKHLNPRLALGMM